MKYSIVIPLYNKALYIRRALDSVLAQTVQDFEILVVDDGSTDNSAAIVCRYTDPCIRLIQQGNAGAAAARNRGISESQTELIAFLDADDQWDPNFLEQISCLIENYPQAGLFATSYRMFNGTEIQYPQIQNLTISVHGHGILKNYLRSMLGPPPFYTSSTVVRKQIMQRVGGFLLGIAHGEDLDTWLRIYMNAPMAFMHSHPVTYFTDTPASAMDSWIPDESFAPICTAQKFIDSGLYDNNLVEDLQDYIVYFQLHHVKIWVFQGQRDRARSQLRKVQKTKRYASEVRSWLFWASMPHFITQGAFKSKALYRHLGRRINSLRWKK